MSRNRLPDFTRVSALPEEIDRYAQEHSGRRPSIYRLRCNECGRRIWGSGLGIGSHRRTCRHIEERRAQ